MAGTFTFTLPCIFCGEFRAEYEKRLSGMIWENPRKRNAKLCQVEVGLALNRHVISVGCCRSSDHFYTQTRGNGCHRRSKCDFRVHLKIVHLKIHWFSTFLWFPAGFLSQITTSRGCEAAKFQGLTLPLGEEDEALECATTEVLPGGLWIKLEGVSSNFVGCPVRLFFPRSGEVRQIHFWVWIWFPKSLLRSPPACPLPTATPV